MFVYAALFRLCPSEILCTSLDVWTTVKVTIVLPFVFSICLVLPPLRLFLQYILRPTKTFVFCRAWELWHSPFPVNSGRANVCGLESCINNKSSINIEFS